MKRPAAVANAAATEVLKRPAIANVRKKPATLRRLAAAANAAEPTAEPEVLKRTSAAAANVVEPQVLKRPATTDVRESKGLLPRQTLHQRKEILIGRLGKWTSIALKSGSYLDFGLTIRKAL